MPTIKEIKFRIKNIRKKNFKPMSKMNKPELTILLNKMETEYDYRDNTNPTITFDKPKLPKRRKKERRNLFKKKVVKKAPKKVVKKPKKVNKKEKLKEQILKRRTLLIKQKKEWLKKRNATTKLITAKSGEDYVKYNKLLSEASTELMYMTFNKKLLKKK